MEILHIIAQTSAFPRYRERSLVPRFIRYRFQLDRCICPYFFVRLRRSRGYLIKRLSYPAYRLDQRVLSLNC